VLEEGIMQQDLFDALIKNSVNLTENFDALPRFVNLFNVKIHSILIQGVRVIVFNPLNCSRLYLNRGRRGHDRKEVGFTITNAISAYHY
jgi:hypothetical protein